MFKYSEESLRLNDIALQRLRERMSPAAFEVAVEMALETSDKLTRGGKLPVKDKEPEI